MPEIPAPEDVLLAALGPLGVSAAILALIGSAFALHSWYSLGRGAIAGAKRMHGLLGSAGGALVRRRPGQVLVAFLVTIIVPSAQLLTLGLCALGGNYVSLMFHPSRGEAIEAAFVRDGFAIFRPDTFVQYLVLDWVVAAYLAVAIVTMAISYRRAWRREDVGKLGAVLAGPVTLILLLLPLFLIVLALYVLFGLIMLIVGEWARFVEDVGWGVIPGLIGFSILGLYYAACQAAVRGSSVVVKTWRP